MEEEPLGGMNITKLPREDWGYTESEGNCEDFQRLLRQMGYPQIVAFSQEKPIDCAKASRGESSFRGKGSAPGCIPKLGLPAQTKRRTEGIRVPVPLACGGSSTARVLLRLCPESACQTGHSLELSSRLEAGGCAVRASPVRLGSLAQPQRRGTSP